MDAVLAASNYVLGRRKPRVSVVIPTIGRTSLRRSIDSARWADEVIVVYDASEVPASAPAGGAIFAACGPTNHFGAEQRERGIALATGTHIAFLDDDDEYAADAGPAVRRALRARPSRVHIFRMKRGDRVFGGYGCVAEGAIGSPMFVVPNDGLLGRWTERYAGDFDFIHETVMRRRRGPRYHADVIAIVRPS